MARPHGGLSPQIVEAVADATDGRPAVIALGGGADSAVLLAAAVAASPDSVRAVFVDHQLESSATLRGAAEELSGRLGVPLTVVVAPVADGSDLEARARKARYRALEAELADGEVGMTGHTLDDQAETVLMRLAAGSGTQGLSGIPRRRGPWRRPLLTLTKTELRGAAEALDLPFADDLANRDRRFVRSRIRHEVVPALVAAVGHPVADAIARSAVLLGTDDDMIEGMAHHIPIIDQGDRVLVPTAPLLTIDRSVASRVCRRALRTMLDGSPGASRDVDGVLAAAATGTTAQLSGDLLAIREGPFVAIGLRRDPPPPVVVAPGDTFRWGSDLYALRSEATPPPVLPGGRFTMLDAAAVGSSLRMRGPHPGDVLGIEVGSTPVAELLRAHGIASSQRPVSLLATVDAKIAAVVGVRTAAWAKPRRHEPCLVIERLEGM